MTSGATRANCFFVLRTILPVGVNRWLPDPPIPGAGVDFDGACAKRATIFSVDDQDTAPTWKGFIRLIFENVDFGWDTVRGAVGIACILIAVVLLPTMLFKLLLGSLARDPKPPPDTSEMVVCTCGRLTSSQRDVCPRCGQTIRQPDREL
jgi:hypothetical protein